MLWSFARLLQSCESFGRAFGGCFARILERQAAHVDYDTLCARPGSGVARGLAAETIVAIWTAGRLALRHESRRAAALRRLGGGPPVPSRTAPDWRSRWHFRKKRSGQTEPQSER